MEIEQSKPLTEPQNAKPRSGRLTPRKHQRRRIFVSVMAMASVVALLWVSNRSGEYYAVMAPGELSNPHAQLWQGSNHAQSCKNCHPGVFPSSVSSQASDDAVSGSMSSHANMSQQEACAVCHAAELHHLLRGSPHDLPQEGLVKLASQQPHTNGTSRLVSLDQPIVDLHLDWQHRSFQCNDCHREHQGRKAKLAAMDNASCQACHQKRFDSFENQHSEFTDYPQPSPTPAFAFNHRSHAVKYFPKQQTQFDCNSCHVKQDASGIQLVRTTSFEAACAACHRDPLSTTLGDGVIVWQLPNVNTEEFVAAGGEPFRWPEIASAVTDLELSPLMRQLIVAELEQSDTPQASLARVRVAAAENLSDLAVESDQANETVRLAAVASQNVLKDIVANGQEAIKKRLKRLHVQGAANAYEERLVDELAKGVPPDLFDEAYRNWFADVSRGDQDQKRAEVPKSPFLPELEPPRAIPQNNDYSLENGFAARAGQAPKSKVAGSADSELLESDLLGDDSSGSDLAGSGLPKGELIGAPAKDAEELHEYDARKHLKAGGWMIDRVRNAIVYIPNGHGDRWMQAYAEWLAQSPEGSPRLPKNEVISRCLECHNAPKGQRTVDAQVPMAQAWHTRFINPKEKKLTRFDHRPHLTLPQLRDCASCHAMNELPGDATQLVSVSTTKSVAQDAASVSPHSGHDFRFVSKKMCVSCHNAETKVQNCTLCHDYHVAPK